MPNNDEISKSIDILSKYYNVTSMQLKRILDNQFTKSDTIIDKNIILPFSGLIDTKCCKAVVYNHGLYTQCTKVTGEEVCKTCSKLKYGRIEDRVKSKQNEFVTPDGKKEIPYDKFMTKMNYTYEEVKKALKQSNSLYKLPENSKSPEKKGRGRPRKIKKEESDDEEKLEEIEVTKIKINNNEYFKTSDNIVLDINTHEPIGVFKDGYIDYI